MVDAIYCAVWGPHIDFLASTKSVRRRLVRDSTMLPLISDFNHRLLLYIKSRIDRLTNLMISGLYDFSFLEEKIWHVSII